MCFVVLHSCGMSPVMRQTYVANGFYHTCESVLLFHTSVSSVFLVLCPCYKSAIQHWGQLCQTSAPRRSPEENNSPITPWRKPACVTLMSDLGGCFFFCCHLTKWPRNLTTGLIYPASSICVYQIPNLRADLLLSPCTCEPAEETDVSWVYKLKNQSTRAHWCRSYRTSRSAVRLPGLRATCRFKRTNLKEFKQIFTGGNF